MHNRESAAVIFHMSPHANTTIRITVHDYLMVNLRVYQIDFLATLPSLLFI